jgi:AmmeMemoRadiSam system protein B
MSVILLGPKFRCAQWYPDNDELLISIITEHYTESSKNVRAVIAPHAGYRYCGEVFSKAMGQINQEQEYDRVFIIGPSHHVNIHNKAHVSSMYGGIITGLYDPDFHPIDYELSKQLAGEDHFVDDSEIMILEHSIHLHAPFIHYTLPDVPIVPIVVGTMDQQAEDQIANSIKNVMTDKSLIMISSDFTHYGEKYNYTPYSEEVDIKSKIHDFDHQVIDLIKQNQYNQYKSFITQNENTICGRHAIAILLNILKDENINIEQHGYSMSGDVTGDYSNSVSYASITCSYD